MSTTLEIDDRIALFKHYEIDVAEGHLRNGTAMTIAGRSAAGNARVMTATIGTHTAERTCPVTDFLAEGMVKELGDSHLSAHPQLSRGIAHLLIKLSRMFVESELQSFALTAAIQGDHYEVLAKTSAIEGSHATTIPHRLSPHAHDRRGSEMRPFAKPRT